MHMFIYIDLTKRTLRRMKILIVNLKSLVMPVVKKRMMIITLLPLSDYEIARDE